MSSPPSSPASVVSVSSAGSTLSPSARERIAANKRRAEQKLATRDRQLQQQQSLFRDYLHNGSPARSTPSPPFSQSSTGSTASSARDVIVLDDEDDEVRRAPARPLFAEDSRRRVDRVQLTAAEREERRYDDEDWDDVLEADAEVQLQPGRTQARAQPVSIRPSHRAASSADTSSTGRPPQLSAAPAHHMPPSARVSAPSSAAPSSRQGGIDHYAHLRSKAIDHSSFTTLAPLPSSYRDSQRAVTSQPASPIHVADSANQPPVNPFTSTAQTYRVSLSSAAAAAKPPPTVQPASMSLASSISQPQRPAAPHVPPHRQDELRSEEEKQLWALFDNAKHPAHPHSHPKRPPPTATYANSSFTSSSANQSHSRGEGTGSGVRKLPGVFDSVAFRAEERQDRERKRSKKEHPLLEERRNAKRLRTNAPLTGASNSQSLSAPVQPASSARFSNPPPPSASRHSAASAAPTLPKSHRKTMMLVDPRVAAAEKAREERQERLQHERLTAQRLKPSLDELHATVLSWRPLQLDSTVRASLESRFVRVPLTFADDVEYQTVFYPLLLEECRAEMMAAMDEMEMAHDERAAEHASGKQEQPFNPRGLLEVVSIASYEKVNAFHHIEVDRVDFDGNKRASLFGSDDLVLLWYRPSATDPFEPNEWRTASLHTLARLERVHDREEAGGKTERRKPGVHYKLQVHVEQSGTGQDDGSVDSKKLLQFLLRTGSQWGVVKVMTLITVHRQYRALQSCHLLSLFPFLTDPASSSRRERGASSSSVLSALRQFPSELIRPFNPSQREAMATAMSATEGITLIQGPPGTGKTKTIVGLINLLLLQPSTTSKPTASLTTGRILICAPSNAAIDEIVVRLLQPDALLDGEGSPLKAHIVRVGAGKRVAGKDVVKSQHNGVDIDAVSLDRLVEDRLKGQKAQNGHDEEGDEDDRRDEVKEPPKEESVSDYDRALERVREKLDDVHAAIHELEEKKHAPESSAVDGSGSAESKEASALQREANGEEQPDVHKLLDAAHKQRKALLAERKHLHGKKDMLFQRLRKRNQLAADNRDAVRLAVLNESHIVCTTLTGAGLELFTSSTASFDCVVIDEAAQAIEVQTLIPLKYECKRCVMVGDDRQLSATVISQTATRFEYQQSLFSRLRKCGVSVKVIQIQYRMHPHIRLFPSTYFYHSQLKDAPSLLASSVVQRHVGLLHPLGSVTPSNNCVDKRIAPYVFYDVKGTESRAGRSSLHNVMEARVATRVFMLLFAAAQRAHSAASSSPFPVADFVNDVGVITPYKQQVNTLRQHFRALFNTQPLLSPLLTQLEVSTVDSFQGREKSYVLFSAVRAHSVEQRAGRGSGIGFVADSNRLNVALTRAKQCLAVLGSAATLSKEPIWRSLVDDARQRQCVVEVREGDTALFNDKLHCDRWRVPLELSMWAGQSTDVGEVSEVATSPAASRSERRGSLSGSGSGSGSKLMMGERRDSGHGLVRRLSGEKLATSAVGEGVRRTSSIQRQSSDERKAGSGRTPKFGASTA